MDQREAGSVVTRYWPAAVSVVAFAAMALSWGRALSGLKTVVLVALLVGAVFASVNHAHVVARRVGSVVGTLILALSVTAIEAGLIITVMAAGGPVVSTLARDSVFSAVVICCNGIMGVCLLLATTGRRMAVFNANITGAAFASVATVVTLSMVMPTFTTSAPGPQFTGAQLAFASVTSLTIYVLYSAMSTVWQRDDLKQEEESQQERQPLAQREPERPSTGTTVANLLLLLVALTAVVGTGELLAPSVESAIAHAGLPTSAVGVVIAVLVLMPETLTAVRAARAGRIQNSFNLALGSAMASAGLTIPVVAVASAFMSVPLHLGLGPKEMTFLALTVVVGTLTVVPGRASLLRGALHLSIFAAFVFLAAIP